LIEQLGAPRFSWGGSSYLVEASTLRQRYIAALQQGWCRWEWELGRGEERQYQLRVRGSR